MAVNFMAVKFGGNGGFAVNKTQKMRFIRRKFCGLKKCCYFCGEEGLCYVYPSTSAMASFRLE